MYSTWTSFELPGLGTNGGMAWTQVFPDGLPANHCDTSPVRVFRNAEGGVEEAAENDVAGLPSREAELHMQEFLRGTLTHARASECIEDGPAEARTHPGRSCWEVWVLVPRP